jgi:nitrous oxide reductase
MNEQSSDRRISRRTLLRGAALGAGAAGIAAAAVGTAPPAQADTQGATGRKQAGYRETEHVRRVYALSRF